MADQPTPTSETAVNPASLRATLSALLDSLPDGVIVLDTDWCIIYANQTAARISRVKPEFIGRGTHWDHYPETLGTSIEFSYREAMATQVERTLPPYYFERFDIWYSIRLVPLDGRLVLHYRDITQQHRAEDNRRDLQDRITNTFAATNGVGVYDWHIIPDRVYADERFANLYGVDPAHAKAGAPLAAFTRNIHPDDIAATTALIHEAMRTGDFAAQYRILQPDGASRWIDTRATITFNDAKEAVRFAGIVVDITDQKETELALRASEERYRILTELSPQSQWSANPQGLVLYANRRFLDYIGHQFVPKTGTEYIECFDPLDRDHVVAVWTHSVLTGEDYDIQARLIRRSDSASRWWHLRALPIRDEDGNIQQWLGTASDIHETRVAADQLRAQFAEIDRQRREVEAIYLGSPIGMALYEPKELRLLRINPRQAEIFGLPAEETIGMRFEDLTAGVSESAKFIRHAAHTGEPVLNHNVEGTLQRSPNDYRYWNINYTPIFAEDGSVRAIAGATIETTTQKRAEAALIQNEKLAAVGRMASSIAHEINNPLESVMNLIYIARQQSVSLEIQTYLDLADQELRRVSIIANQTLRFHKQATRPQAISCLDLYSTVLSMYEGRLKNSGIQVENRRRAQQPITCFEGEIRQVLNNLVGNAIDAMPTGGRLLVRSREGTDWRSGTRSLILTIADTGSGISPETQSRMFEAFFTTKGIQGTGLGLWISCEIMHRNRGRIRMRSSQNPARHGTVFTLFLPYELPTT